MPLNRINRISRYRYWWILNQFWNTFWINSDSAKLNIITDPNEITKKKCKRSFEYRINKPMKLVWSINSKLGAFQTKILRNGPWLPMACYLLVWTKGRIMNGFTMRDPLNQKIKFLIENVILILRKIKLQSIEMKYT